MFCIAFCCDDHKVEAGFPTFGQAEDEVTGYYALPPDSPILKSGGNLGRNRYWPGHGKMGAKGWELHQGDAGAIYQFTHPAM